MADEVLDCKGLVCPIPIAQIQRKIREMQAGQTLAVEADCEEFSVDVDSWSEKTGHAIISKTQNGPVTSVVIKI